MRSADSQSGVNKAYYKRALNRLHIPNSVVATSPDRNAARVSPAMAGRCCMTCGCSARTTVE